jgi:hypothetical protein
MSNKKTANNFLGSLLDGIVLDATQHVVVSDESIVDVITFCESPQYLNLVGQDPPLTLWPMQKIVLKLFYRGSRGNEHLTLTEEERSILLDIAETEVLDYEKEQGGFLQVIEQYDRCVNHTQLLLVMGRRSSKTLMVSIIASYEAYKLLELGNKHMILCF